MNELRPVALADAPTLLRWRNLPHVAEFMYTSHQITEAEHARWFARLLNDSSLRGWIIVADGHDVGFVNLYGIDEAQRRCYWAFYVGDGEAQGKGVGRFVEFAILDHVFETMGFRKLCCEVLATNARVVKMHERFGFVVEGQLREHVVKDGEPVDVFSLGILRSEWADRVRESGRELALLD